ncbi:MAG: exopolysaccharide Pel transporter PelG [Planctomycetota bacterium]
MAGIGFELRRMMDDGQSLMSRVRGYACAGLISSGPWIMTIITLGVLSAFQFLLSPRSEFEIFRGLITYAFAFSLIVVGVLQMTVTRRVADLLYTKKYENVLPAFNASVIVIGVFQVLIGSLFCWWAGLSAGLAVVAVALYVIVSLIWLALIWLGVTREFDRVLVAYGLGSIVIFVFVGLLDRPLDAKGLLTAYTAGQAVILILLMRTVVRGMQSGGTRSFAVLRSVPEFPRLMLIGLLYNAAIWVDKMMFWFMDGIGPVPNVLFHPLYDTCCFLAYLTVIPALAVNLVRVETSFYECYRSYFGAILSGMPLKVIDRRRGAMLDNLQEGMVRLLRIQGAITLLCILFAPEILSLIELPPSAVRIFRAVCLGAFFHVMLLITILMQLYFDLRKQALVTSVVFLVLNGVLAVWSVKFGINTYGFGYAAAAMISLLVGYSLLAKSIEYLDYYTFTNQPITAERAKASHGEKAPEAEEEEEDPEDDVEAEPEEAIVNEA